MTGDDVMKELGEREEIIQKIRNKFPNVSFPSPTIEPIYFGRLNKNPVNGRVLLMDRGTGAQFDIVSKQYNLVYHEEVVNNLIESCPKEFGAPQFDISFFKNGARANISAKFPDIKDYDIDGSKTEPEVNLRNSYDRSSHLSYSYGLRELVCSNGLTAYREKERTGAKHIGKSIKSFNLEKRIRTSLEDLSEHHKIWIGWTKLMLSKEAVMEVIEELPYSEKEKENLLSLPLLNQNGATLQSLEGKITLWNINSAATQYVHQLKSAERKLDIEQTVPSVITNAFNRLAA